MADLEKIKEVLAVAKDARFITGAEHVAVAIAAMEDRLALAARIEAAIGVAVRFGQIDGAHHKAWSIDQMVRALTGCQMEDDAAVNESDEYKALVVEYQAGEDGPESYKWDTGISP